MEWLLNGWSMLVFGIIIGVFGGMWYKVMEVIHLSTQIRELQNELEQLEDKYNAPLPIHRRRKNLGQ